MKGNGFSVPDILPSPEELKEIKENCVRCNCEILISLVTSEPTNWYDSFCQECAEYIQKNCGHFPAHTPVHIAIEFALSEINDLKKQLKKILEGE